MRRMYGDQRHISVLRAEIESNDVEDSIDNEWKHREHIQTNYGNKVLNTEPTVMKEFTTPSMTTVVATDSTPREVLINTDSGPSSSMHFNATDSILSGNTTTPTLKLSPSQETLDSPTRSTSSHDTNVTPPPGLNLSTDTDGTTFMPEYGTITDQTELVTESVTMPETTTFQEGPTTLGVQDDEEAEEDEESEESVQSEAQLFQDVRAKDRPASPVMRLRGVNACPVKEEVVAPFWANNTRGEVLALLNLYPFEQYVHWEKCTFELKQMYCREGCRCEQQYRLHRLLAYDPNNECRGIFSDWFKFPSCCVCRCYDLPLEFQMTSRSPRTKSRSKDRNVPPHWYKVVNNK
ncbi:protein spaetzle 4 isoform X2 [Anabrus simplex]